MPKARTMPRLFTTQEAAAYCGLTLANFKYYLREGRVKADFPSGPPDESQQGRTLLFRRSTLDAFRTQERRPAGRPRQVVEE